MIEGISAVTLGTHEMPRAVRFYRALGLEVLYGGEDSSFTGFRAGTSYLNLIAQPAERRWSWWGRVSFTLPMLTHFTTVRSERDTSQLPCPAMPSGVSASST
jgi:catechol 2,3-dioxygenase-like lactoylglutathione lyase family enzyme